MSIINEALKKTQSSISNLQGKPSSPGNFGSPGNPPSSGRALLIVIVLIVGGIIFYVALSPKPVKSTARRISPPPASVQEVAVTPKPTTEPAPTPKPELTLYGIISSADGKTALINSEILKEGDTILGKKILKIYDNRVELDDSGKVMTLKTR